MGSVDADRTVSFPGYSDDTSAGYDVRIGQAFGEVGYGVVAQGVAFEPFFGLATVHLDTDGFSESGGAAALTADGSSSDYGTATVGLRAAASYLMAVGNRRVTAAVRGVAARVRRPVDRSVARFRRCAGDRFTVSGVA